MFPTAPSGRCSEGWCAREFLKCRPSGYGKTLLYLPAIASADIVEIALKRVAEDFYQGSLFEAATAIHAFLAARQDLHKHA